MTYTKGLHEVGDGIWAYLQPDGGWGWSNAGLVTSGEASLLVDTLFDLKLTREMLDAMARATPAAAFIGTVVNTHANGDHCYGNSLVATAEIIASRRCADEMKELPPSRLADMVRAAPGLGEVGAFVARIFGPFSFDGIEMALPTRTFDGELEIHLGDRLVRLIEVGPAHTEGDVIVHLPDDGVVFTGDILFHGGHPVVWAGPVAGWLAACDRITALGARTVVPGHGPLAGNDAVADLKGYLEYLTREARPRYEAGLTPLEAARDIDMSAYSGWGESERVVANIHALYRDFGAPAGEETVTAMADMAALAGAAG
ncbi:MAG TPA: MBL fold metallo-hydrolase [Acidimicrobiales bacterium]|nr:MBL fold metallo-hydrolase [Acidimicrobiales bacterium]